MYKAVRTVLAAFYLKEGENVKYTLIYKNGQKVLKRKHITAESYDAARKVAQALLNDTRNDVTGIEINID